MLRENGTSCRQKRRVEFYLNVKLEYVEVLGATCQGRRRVKYYINVRLAYV
jgi:hypothetical protein